MKEPHNVIIVGIPDSGKSNYIIRLWLALRQNNCLLHGDGDPDDIEYLENGVNQQLSGQYAPHTPHEVFNHNSVPVKSFDENVRGILEVPDYSGEVWEQIYKDREWPIEWDSWINSNTAFLIFIRAGSDGIIPTLDWISYEKEFGDLTHDLPQNKETVRPTEVIITEWIQFFRRVSTDLIGGDHKLKIGIIISAWDSVPNDQQELGPNAYIESNYAMLQQVMDANSDQYEFKAFGVSLTGGNLNLAKHRKEYFEKNPNKTGFVCYHKGNKVITENDLTIPVAWGMGIL